MSSATYATLCQYITVCDGTQNVKRYRYRYFFPVPNIFDTDTGTFFGTKFFRYRFRDFFPIPNFTDTGSETFSGTKFFRYRFRYHLKKLKIPGSGAHQKSSEFQNFGNKNELQYQIFPIPVPRLFSGTKFYRYRFRYHQKNGKIPSSGTNACLKTLFA